MKRVKGNVGASVCNYLFETTAGVVWPVRKAVELFPSLSPPLPICVHVTITGTCDCEGHRSLKSNQHPNRISDLSPDSRSENSCNTKCPVNHQNTRNHRVRGHYHHTEAPKSWSASFALCKGFSCTFFSQSKLSLNFSASFCILSSASCALSVSHLSPLKVWPVERERALCEGWCLQTAGNRSARRSNGLLLCEPSLALCSSPLFISLMSFAGYMLLIKHAARLLIVNQIQFVPRARSEWASPPRTKVSKQPCQSWTKDPRHHFYLPQLEPLQHAGSHWMRCYPDRFPEGHSRHVQREHSCTLPCLIFSSQWHLGKNRIFICSTSAGCKNGFTWVYTQNLYPKYSKNLPHF